MLDNATTQDALQLIALALVEDIGSANIHAGFDCTTQAIVPPTAKASASFVSREQGIVCGIEICRLILAKFADQLSLKVFVEDGDPIAQRQTIATLSGSAFDILTIERTCLNFLGRLSGISSLTQRFVTAIAGTTAQVFDTRKTTPGWRRLEKYAVACGGGQNHRMGLFDAIMIKDNHLAFYRSLVADNEDTIPQAIRLARKWIAQHQSSLPKGLNTALQLEVDSIEQLKIGLQTDCDIILLDNMSTEMLQEGVRLRNQENPLVILEASGGVNLSTIRAIAETGVERISVGALTHSAINFDIGLDWDLN